MQRDQCPVFIMGCPRSGTNFLYDNLLSAGGFAVYRGRIPVHHLLIPRFGNLNSFNNRARMVECWSRSKGFQKSGLEVAELGKTVMKSCRSGGDFLRIVMGAIARKQKASRWAVYNPDNVLHVATIKREIPEALFVHIIRDGRDVTLSLCRHGEFRPFPWSHQPRGVEETALYWQWMVRKGRRDGSKMSSDYREIRYERLISDPKGTLADLAEFLNQDLDYDRIQRTALGTIRKRNSSFPEEPTDFIKTVERWKQQLSPAKVAAIEWHTAQTLEESGYSLSGFEADWTPTIRDKCLRTVYPLFLEFKLWAKTRTPLGRTSSLAELQLSPPRTFPFLM